MYKTVKRATTKKGFWTLTRVVKLVYTQYDDFNYCDEPLSLKKAIEAADISLEETEAEGITIETIKGENWKEEDFDEDE